MRENDHHRADPILYGTIHRIGEVDDGNTVMDWMQQERERESPSPLPQSPPSGKAFGSISLILPGMLILQLKLSVL